MTGYTDAVGGAPIQTSEVGYLAITLSATTAYQWPYANEDNSNVVAKWNDVTASTTSLEFRMPSATQVSPGEYAIINNVGSNTFTVTDVSGNEIQAIDAGDIYYIQVTDNSTEDGTWESVGFGIGTSAATAAALAGNGLTVLASRLNLNHPVSAKSADYTVLTTDRATTLISTGGAVNFSFTNPATLTNGWFALIKNSGTGLLTLTPLSGTIDGASSLALNLNDACFVVSNGTNLYTVGLGRISPEAVTRLVVPVTGGSTTLTASQALYDIIEFSGVLASNQTILMPIAVNEWNLYNNTTGAFTLTVNPATGGGTGVTLVQTVRSYYLSNGTDIVSAIPAANVAIIPPALGGSWIYYGGTTGGSGNAQIVSATVPSDFPQDVGDIVTFIAGFSNTTITTLQVNAFPSAVVKKHNDSALIDISEGDIVAGATVAVMWDGTYYQMLSQTSDTNDSIVFWGGTTGGTANAQTIASTNPATYSQTVGDTVNFIVGTTNTGATTLTVNATTTATIKKHDSSGLTDVEEGDLPAGAAISTIWDGTYYQMVSSSSSSFRGAAAVLSAPQTIASNTPADISWSSVDEDTDSFWSIGDPTKFTIPAGVNRVSIYGQAAFEADTGGGIRSVNIRKNGGSFYGQGHNQWGVGTNNFTFLLSCFSMDIPVTAGDYFQLRVNQTTGSSIDILATDETWFKIRVTG